MPPKRKNGKMEAGPEVKKALQLHQTLSCNVCCESFDDAAHSPRMLACHHTFCLDCLTAIQTKALEKKTNIPCPTCRQETVVPQETADCIPRNFALLDVIEARKQKPLRQREPNHLGAVATSSDLASANSILCPTHGREIELVCALDGQPICAKCVPSHFGHPLQEPMQVWMAQKPELQLLADRWMVRSEVLEKTLDDIKTRKHQVQINTRRVLNVMDDHLQKTLASIKESYAEKKNQVIVLSKQKLDLLEKQRSDTSEVSHNLRHGAHSIRDVDHTTHGPLDLETVLSGIDRIFNWRKQVQADVQTKKNVVHFPIVDADIEFVPNETLIRDEKRFGSVVEGPASAAHSKASGKGLHGAHPDEIQEFQVQVMDKLSRKLISSAMSAVSVCLSSADHHGPDAPTVEKKDCEDGTVVVEYKLPAGATGEWMLNVLVKGKDVPDSPFRFSVTQGWAPSSKFELTCHNRRCTKILDERTWKATVFGVQTYSSGKHEWRVMGMCSMALLLIGVSSGLMSSPISDSVNGFSLFLQTGFLFSESVESRPYLAQGRVNMHDVVSVLLDCDAHTLSYAINGVSQGVAFADLPSIPLTLTAQCHRGNSGVEIVGELHTI